MGGYRGWVQEWEGMEGRYRGGRVWRVGTGVGGYRGYLGWGIYKRDIWVQRHCVCFMRI